MFCLACVYDLYVNTTSVCFFVVFFFTSIYMLLIFEHLIEMNPSDFVTYISMKFVTCLLFLSISIA